MSAPVDLGAEVQHFAIAGRFLGATPFGAGHINDSYCATFEEDRTRRRYIVQRINTGVFTNPDALMQNIERVTQHVAGQLAGTADRDRRVLRFVPTHDGRVFRRDEQGHCWRVMRYIEDTQVLHTVGSPDQAFRIAAAFGRFQQQLASMPVSALIETIPNFHNTPKRLKDFERAIERDVAGRVKYVHDEIAFAKARKQLAGELVNANLPERVVHNDAKCDNVLLDDRTGEAICVVDLDTVMPGLAVYDFGDMVRSMTSQAAEDEQDLTRVSMQFPIFEALLRGFLATAGGFLTDAETRMLPSAGKVITFENGLRFLTDYLSGDTYYKVHRDGQNLDRCRTHFKLVESIEAQDNQMSRLVESLR